MRDSGGVLERGVDQGDAHAELGEAEPPCDVVDPVHHKQRDAVAVHKALADGASGRAREGGGRECVRRRAGGRDRREGGTGGRRAGNAGARERGRVGGRERKGVGLRACAFGRQSPC